VTHHIQITASEQEAVILARESFRGELKRLNQCHPDTGFGVSLRTRSGDLYLLANASMPLPAARSDGFPTGRRVACLENGEHFSSIEVLADSRSLDAISPGDEANMLVNALDLIDRIDASTRLPEGELCLKTVSRIAATGTGG